MKNEQLRRDKRTEFLIRPRNLSNIERTSIFKPIPLNLQIF